MKNYLKITNNKILYLNIILFLFIFFFPNNHTYYFDGLPFTNKYETILFTIIFPLTFFFGFYFKSFKILVLLIFISLIKFYIIGHSSNGVNVKQYFSPEERNANKYIKTFDTFWNKDTSYVQKYAWKNQKNFPLDWTHLSKVNRKKNNQEKLYIDKYYDFEKLSMFYDFSFFVVNDHKKEIILDIGKSSRIISKKVSIYDQKINQFVDLDKNIFKKQLLPSKGIYKFEISINYLGNDWKFNPYFVDNEKKFSLFKEKIIFSEINIDDKFLLKKNFGNLYEFLIFVLIFSILLEIYKKKLNFEKKIIIYGVTFFLFYLLLDQFIKYLFNQLGIIDGVGSFSFGLSNLILVTYFAFNLFIINKINKQTSLFVLTSSITCLIVFSNIFFYDLETFSWAGSGDDWTTFQEYSRQIVVENKWLEAGEEVFYFRPGSRYIYAINHILFGMSAFSYKMLNIWSIILCSYLVIEILLKMRCTQFISHLAGILLLTIFTADNFRWILIVGLSEYYAMILMIIKIYIIYNKKSLSFVDLFILLFLGFIQIWLREEHVPVVLSLIFLMSFKVTSLNIPRFFPNYFINFSSYFFQNYKIIIFYSILIIIGFSSIFIRNYFVGGSIGLFDIHAVKTLIKDESIFTTYYHVFSRLIFGVDQYYPTLPKFYSVFNVFAIIISFKIIFNYQKYNYYHLGLPIVLFAIIFPYFFVENIAYTPRYTIHLLPVSIIMTFVYINKYIENKNAKNSNFRF